MLDITEELLAQLEVEDVLHGFYKDKYTEDEARELLDRLDECSDDYRICGTTGALAHIDEMIYIEDHGEMHLESEIDYVECYIDEVNIFEDDAVECLNGRNHDVYIHRRYEDELVYTEDDCCYVSVEAAEQNDYVWCEYAEAYTQNPRRTAEEFHNPFGSGTRIRRDINAEPKSPRSNLNLLRLGEKSLSWRKTNGTRYSFGVEIETHGSSSDGIDESYAYDNYLNISAVYDGSISGKEYVTGVLTGDHGFRQVKKICKTLNHFGYTVDKACGIHIHISGPILNREFQMYSIMLGILLQDELFEMLPKSRKQNTYCKKINNEYLFDIDCNSINDITCKNNLALLAKYTSSTVKKFDKNYNKKSGHPNGRYDSSRYKWLNLNNCSFKGHDTIEFRLHNSTIMYSKIEKAIQIYMAFIKYIDDNKRYIHMAFKDYQNFMLGVSPKINSHIDLPGIIHNMYSPKEAINIISYIEERKAKFSCAY